MWHTWTNSPGKIIPTNSADVQGGVEQVSKCKWLQLPVSLRYCDVYMHLEKNAKI